MTRRRAVVLGVNGQDGSLLAAELSRRSYEVYGFARQAAFRDVPPERQFHYRCLDLRNADQLANALAEARPDAIFHVAAIHGPAGTTYERIWQDMLAVNVGSVHVVLEYARTLNPACRIVYASSSKVFTHPLPAVISETSAQSSSCLYTVSKNAARDLIDHYRRQHAACASILYLFHHESERRPSHYFVPTIVRILAASLTDPAYYGTVESLDFHCDWGSATEFMDIAVDISELANNDDFVIATGASLYARSYVEELFRRHGLDHRRHVRERKATSENSDFQYRCSLEKLERLVHRRPQSSIFDVSEEMISRIRPWQ